MDLIIRFRKSFGAASFPFCQLEIERRLRQLVNLFSVLLRIPFIWQTLITSEIQDLDIFFVLM